MTSDQKPERHQFSEQAEGELDPDEALNLIRTGMDVVDRNDAKIGKVVHVYRPVGVDEQDSMSYDAYVQVGDRGFLGIAKDIYVPARFVQDVQGETVRIGVEKARIPDMVWDQPVPLPGNNL
jgi:hypothetical protein